MSGRNVRWLFGLVTVVLAAFVAAACGPGEESGGGGSDELAKEQKLTMNIANEPTSLDPPTVSDIDATNVLNQMFAGLYRIEGQESELTPYLAEDLPEVSDDGLTYTVKMREDAKWSDGQPVTAEDVVNGVRYALAPDTAAPFAQFFLGIVGACEYNTSAKAEDEKPKDDEETCDGLKTDRKAESIGVRAVDEHTVEFKLEQPTPWFDQLLSIPITYPLRTDVIEKHGAKWTEPENIVVSGPFKLKEWKHGQYIVMEKNPEFWGADDVRLETIRMEMVKNPQTALRQFEQKRLDTGLTRMMVPVEDLDDVKTRDEYVSVQTTGTQYAYFNTRNDELKDPKVRQGLALAIDRKSIVENITKRGDIPLNTVIPTTLPGYDTIKEGSQDFIGADEGADLDKARDLLEEGGWKDGTELSVYYTPDSGAGEPIAEAVRSDWEKVGAEVKLVPLSGQELYGPGFGTSPVDPKVDVILLGWAADYLDAQDYYQLFTCPNIEGGLNASNFCDEEFDKLYNESLEVLDDDARFEMYRELEAMLTGPDGLMPAAPLYQPTDDTLVQEWVKNYEITPGALLFLDDVYITER